MKNVRIFLMLLTMTSTLAHAMVTPTAPDNDEAPLTAETSEQEHTFTKQLEDATRRNMQLVTFAKTQYVNALSTLLDYIAAQKPFYIFSNEFAQSTQLHNISVNEDLLVDCGKAERQVFAHALAEVKQTANNTLQAVTAEQLIKAIRAELFALQNAIKGFTHNCKVTMQGIPSNTITDMLKNIETAFTTHTNTLINCISHIKQGTQQLAQNSNHLFAFDILTLITSKQVTIDVAIEQEIAHLLADIIKISTSKLIKNITLAEKTGIITDRVNKVHAQQTIRTIITSLEQLHTLLKELGIGVRFVDTKMLEKQFGYAQLLKNASERVQAEQEQERTHITACIEAQQYLTALEQTAAYVHKYDLNEDVLNKIHQEIEQHQLQTTKNVLHALDAHKIINNDDALSMIETYLEQVKILQKSFNHESLVNVRSEKETRDLQKLAYNKLSCFIRAYIDVCGKKLTRTVHYSLYEGQNITFAQDIKKYRSGLDKLGNIMKILCEEQIFTASTARIDMLLKNEYKTCKNLLTLIHQR